MSLIGQTIAQYQILEQLGAGGMGIVYKARDTKLDREVALKFLPPQLSCDDNAKNRFTQEARAASALNHANICAIHDIRETDDGQLFIVMALYDGQTLKRHLDDGPLEVSEAIAIVRQIAEGLSAAHEKGIVHRDIKPANIMITEKGRAVILDFGLAKLTGAVALTKTGSTIGTTAYMSPEQARGDAVGQQSDLWSLGAVSYEMMTGRKPFPGDYDQAVIYGILNSEPDVSNAQWAVRSEQSAKLQRIVLKALAKHPDHRYASAADFIADLDAIEIGGVVARPTRPLNRNLVYASLAAVVVLIAVAMAVLIPNSKAPIDSVAVLPLANLSGDENQEFLADGITDALINE
ncbi:MAG: serine/threonine-protein kinase, partial [Rhodothermia bacterium]